MIQYYYLYKNIPRLDLHGKTSFEMIVLVDGFIKENKAMKNYLIGIIHGKGSGILKRELHKYLKNNRSVVDFKLNIYNDGETIVEIK